MDSGRLSVRIQCFFIRPSTVFSFDEDYFLQMLYVLLQHKILEEATVFISLYIDEM